MRKPVFRVSDQVPHKPGCTTTQDGLRLEISDLDRKGTRFDVYETLCPQQMLYIKVAKLRTGVGSAKTSYLQNCSVKLFKEHFKVQIFKGRLFEKNKITFFKFSPIDLLIILYQLTKFEAPSCYNF